MEEQEELRTVYIEEDRYESRAGKTKIKLVDQTSRHIDTKRFECKECGKKFTHKTNLSRHVFMHRGARDHQCQECGKRFSQKGNLKQHMLTHRGNKISKCQECGEKFTSKSKHICAHISARNDECQESETTNTHDSEANPTSHREHVDSSNVAMEAPGTDSSVSSMHLQEQCASGVSESVEGQENHVGTASSVYKDEKVECLEYEKTIETSEQLVEHTFKHSDIGYYNCQECGKNFTNKSNLMRHVLIHVGIKNHECQLCGKRFNQKGNLNQHMLTHRGDKNYECHLCGERFTHKSNLTRHIFIHTGVRNHECTVCGKTFNQKGNLNQHMLLHIGEKNFECHICGQKFIHKSNLTRHTFIHTGIRNHECTICGKTFNQKGNLDQHMLIHRVDRNFGSRRHGKKLAKRSKRGQQEQSALMRNTGKNSEDNYNRGTSFCKDKSKHLEYEKTLDDDECGFADPIVRHNDTADYEYKDCESRVILPPKSNITTCMLIKSGIRKFECHLCGERFTEEHHLNEHILTHAENKSYECKACGKKYTRQSPNNYHIHLHTCNRNYECLECGKKFPKKSHLNEHTVNHSDGANVPPDVSNAGSGNGRAEDEGAHSNRNSWDQMVQCAPSATECEENQRPLMVNVSARDDKRKFQCLKCGKIFNVKSRLTHHTLRGSCIRNYMCIECGKIFLSQSNLKRHTLIHKEVKNYQCEKCGKTFNHRGNFNQHMLKHENEPVKNTYECKQCGKILTLNQNSNLTKYIHVYTGQSCSPDCDVKTPAGTESSTHDEGQP